MSGIEINDLPNEAIIKILRNLGQDDLPHASLTCKLWKDLIESSCRWSLILYHNNEDDVDEPWIDFMLSTNRKFGVIQLDTIMFIDKTLKIFQRHGPNVVKLYLIGGCIDSLIGFAKVLKCMPNLKHVIILDTSKTSGVDDAPLPSDLPDLLKLETLEMLGSEYSIVKCFDKAKLTTMKIFNSSHNFYFDCKPLEEFLKSQKMLTTLAFRSVHHKTSAIFHTENLNSMPFNLTHLSLLNMRLQESPNDYNNLLKFMKPHAKTLKVLELGRYFPSFVFEFVFANMTKLQTISMMMTEIPKDKDFHERLEENRNIKNLIFSNAGGFNDETSHFLGDFLKKLPNVDSLNVRAFLSSDNMEIIATNLNLQCLRLGEFVSADKRFFEIIREKCPNLKVFDLHTSNVPSELKDQLTGNSLRLCDGDAFESTERVSFWNDDDDNGRMARWLNLMGFNWDGINADDWADEY